jgi:hypothetical protein
MAVSKAASSSRPLLAIVASFVALTAACDGGDDPSDGGIADGTTDAVMNVMPMSPAPAVLTPCAPGFREVVDGETTICDPYPESGPESCEPGEAHFPGGGGCESIGEPCPAGDFAEALPADTIYVQAGAAAGGDGSAAAPYDGLGRVSWTSLGSGATVALSKGSFEGSLPLKAGVTVVGACAAETTLTGVDAPVASVVTVTSSGDPAVVRNLTIRGAPQYGVGVSGGRSIRLEGVHIDGVLGLGVNVFEAETVIELSDVVVSSTVPNAGALGRGINIESGAHLNASRTVVDDCTDLGVAIQAASASLTNVAVRGTKPQPISPFDGAAILVAMSSQIEATGLYLEDNIGGGLTLTDGGSSATLEEVLVRNTSVQPRGLEIGVAIQAQIGARLTGSRIALLSNQRVGLAVIGDGATAVLSDVFIADTLSSQRSMNDGYGLWAEQGASIEAERVVVARARDVAVGCSDDARLSVTDLTVMDTLAQEADEAGGYGLVAQTGAEAELERFSITTSLGVGMVSIQGGRIDATDGRIVDVDVSACATTTCAERPYGYGLGAIDGAIDLDRFEVREARTCGVMIAGSDAALVLHLGTVSMAAIGACVQVDGYDLTRLSDEVEFRDNESNLDTTSLPVITPVNPL